MKAFDLLNQFLHMIGIWRFDQNRMDIFCGIILKCIFGAIFLNYATTTLWYFLRTAQTFAEYAESFYYVLCAVVMFLWCAMYFVQKNNFATLFIDLDAIVEKRSRSDDVKEIYQKTHESIETLTKIIFSVSAQIVLPLYMILTVVISVYTYIASDFSNESFHQIYPATYPFDWKTPSGYFACVIAQWSTSIATAALFFSTLVLNIGVYLFATGFISDIEKHLHKLNDDFIRAKSSQEKSDGQFELKKGLTDTIKFHSEAMQFTNRFSDINSGFLFAYLIFTVMAFCVLFLLLDESIEAGDYIESIRLSIPTFGGITSLFLFCYIGDGLTQHFEYIGTITYELDWHSYPLDVQKDLQVIIMLSQKKVYLKGFAGIGCTRELFMTIMRSSYTYFMILESL